MADKNVYAVILVGGKGKRLRPLSTDARPKAFMSITKDRKTMFAKTVERISKLVPTANIIAVANKRHAVLVNKEFPEISGNNLLLEPAAKNTAPAIMLAAATLARRVKDAILVILPTDQYIAGEDEYLVCVKRGIDFVKSNKNAIVALGVKPRHPSTGFGYIRVGRRKSGLGGIYKAERFIEKPDLKRAISYVKSGRCLWNTGAFIFRLSAIIKAMKAFAPRIYKGLRDIDDLLKAYNRLPDISIDFAIMEKAKNIYCVEGAYGWRDMGNFESLRAILISESRDFVSKGKKIIRIL